MNPYRTKKRPYTSPSVVQIAEWPFMPKDNGWRRHTDAITVHAWNSRKTVPFFPPHARPRPREEPRS